MQVLHASVRRQLLHRPLPALPRATTSPRSADRVELRHDGQARDPVPQRASAAERWSPTGCRSSMPTSRARPSACPGCRSGRTTSSGTASPIPRRAGRATTACSRRRSWSRSTGRSGRASGCWARPASRSRARSSATASFDHLRSADELRRGLRAKNMHNTVTWRCSCWRGGSTSSRVTVLALAAVDLYASLGRSAFALADRLSSRVHRRLLRAGRAAGHGVHGPAGRGTARSTTRTSGGTNATGSCAADGYLPAASTAPRSRT